MAVFKMPKKDPLVSEGLESLREKRPPLNHLLKICRRRKFFGQIRFFVVCLDYSGNQFGRTKKIIDYFVENCLKIPPRANPSFPMFLMYCM